MNFDSLEYRKALGCFPTGVTVVTSLTGRGTPIGVTVGSFTSLSLDPPLVLFCLDDTNPDLASFAAKGAFVINVLEESQREISIRFGSRLGEQWAGLDYDLWQSGVPVLKGCLANLECTTVDIGTGGDHKIFIGRVERLVSRPEGRPLLYYRGSYCGLERPEL